MDEDSAGRVSANQVTNKGQYYQQAGRGSGQGEPRETLDKRRYEVNRKMAVKRQQI